MTKKSANGEISVRERREELAAMRLKKRDEVASEVPEFERVTRTLLDLGDSTQHPALRREILALHSTVRSALEGRVQQAEMLAEPGVAELLLPIGIQHRLLEADIHSARQVREALADNGLKLKRLPSVGSTTCEVIRAHLDAMDAGEPPPQKPSRSPKVVGLTKREKLLAQKMGLSPEQAGDLLKGER